MLKKIGMKFGIIVPVEIKAEENLNAKSLKAFMDKYDPERAIRISMKNIIVQEKIVNIPLWAVSGLGIHDAE